MILEFSIENYRSFKDRQTFSMIPDEGKIGNIDNIITIAKKYKVLKTAILYGANASGKSNFIKAFKALRDLITKSAERKPHETFEEYDPFAFSTETSQGSTAFEIDFLLEEIRYNYAFAIESATVVQEKLSFYPKGKETKLFSRNWQDFEFGESLKGQKAVLSELTAENQLFLSKGAVNNITQLMQIYDFFKQQFLVIPVMDKLEETIYVNQIISENLLSENNPAFYKKFRILLKSFDTGVLDFKIEEKEKGSWSLSDYKISMEHELYDAENNATGTLFRPIYEESTGTRKLFALAGLILKALENGSTLITDEFERSLHPTISNYIISMFNNPEINTKGAQLIAATHDTNLLSNEKLRRDQIWIVEKDKTGASELFALTDLKGVRNNVPLEQWYLSGRFGGIANLESLNFELAYKNEAN